MSLKIGLLLDSSRIPVWQKHIIQFMVNNPACSIQLLVFNGSAQKPTSRHLVYRVFRKLDRSLFSVKNDCFKRVDISELLTGIEVLKVIPKQSTFTDEITEEDVDHIKSKNLDVLIRFGFRILKGDILHAAKWGVWSLHHGDNAVNRGGPPAFWEVVNQEPVTGVTLQILSDHLDGGQVIDKAFIRTDRTSFNRSQNALYWAGIELFCHALLNLTHNHKITFPLGERSDLPSGQAGFYSKPLYRDPDNGKALLIFVSFWLRRYRELLKSLFKKQQWSLYYKFNNTLVETALYRYKKITPPHGTDWADPFVVYKENKYYVFFEELVHRNKKAHISYFEFNHQGVLASTLPVKVLEESFHLSYPFIVEHEGIQYMIPEAAKSKSVWLYRCLEFPRKWEKHKELLGDVAFYDTTLHVHEGTWYLFGTQKPFEGNSPDQYLHIYFSNDLFSGSWNPHPQNPITRDVRGARPAGRIFEHNGKLIRPSQIGAPKYGYGIRFWEIIKLTPTEFEEAQLEDILPEWRAELLATHTFNFVDGFSVVDGQE